MEKHSRVCFCFVCVKEDTAQEGMGMSEAEIAAWVRYGGDRGKATVVKHH